MPITPPPDHPKPPAPPPPPPVRRAPWADWDVPRTPDQDEPSQGATRVGLSSVMCDGCGAPLRRDALQCDYCARIVDRGTAIPLRRTARRATAKRMPEPRR